ncbi:hypothetical protein J2Y58_000515 [Sphingomonas sp. BE138]|uniref:hypothetical protein n=1 Tax=Sphingomonas sp. BE138 TaxID=2817845 RepID=UPI00285BF474|nr:hypothetical protein [Sphingomonas sp. BE138]MDR6787177.1 hypothetical protein [Sphingomonas sp. BE138]
MSAVARAALAALGRDLGGVAAPRKRALADPAALAIRWEELALVPGWLRQDEAARDTLARRVAALALADELARSIDGAWLGALAEVAGSAAIDHAIAHADTGLPQCAWVAADALAPLGHAILRRSLAPGLRTILPPASDTPLALTAGEARQLVAAA